MAEKWRKWLI